ncbi:MAG: methyltransferase [Paludibacteraceae bacterium]|nr:methyltransferase [Paludibacteraceae bacterium]
MARSEGFQFKQFYLRHDRCAMKVGTDGVLLGAWTPVPIADGTQVVRILDVGTGCGLIARMLMQRCPEAEVEGIDINEAAVEQARENGVKAYCSSLQEWQIVNRKSSNRKSYDLVVSNPPYFRNSLKNPDAGRQLARHTDSLSYEELFLHSRRLLAPNGQLALILPAETEAEVIELATQHSLYCTRMTRVYGRAGKAAKRILLLFGPEKINVPETDTLVLESTDGGRSPQYSALAQEFYL